MTSVTAIAIILIISISMIATVPAFAKPSAKNLEVEIKNAFLAYLEPRGLGLGDIESASEQQASDLFSEFLNDNPSYGVLLNAYYEASGQYPSFKEDIDITYEQLQNGKVLQVVSTTTEVVDGVEYTVEITEVKVGRFTIYKVNYKSADGSIIQDPYIYITHAYLYFWWWVTGEYVDIQYKYMKNAGGINEALRLRHTMEQFSIYGTFALGAIFGALAVLLGAFAPLMLIPTLISGFWIAEINMELKYAYERTSNYLRLIIRVSHNYSHIGCWYDFHTICGDGSWHMIGFPMVDLGIITEILLNGIKAMGNYFGKNSWVWIGTYYG